MIPVQLKSDVISETLETLDLLKTNMLLVLECRMQIEYEVGSICSTYVYQMQMNSQEDIFLKNLISKNLEVILMYLYLQGTVNTFVSKSGHLRFFQKLPNIIFGTFSHFYQSFENLRGQIYNHNILYVPSVIAEM